MSQARCPGCGSSPCHCSSQQQQQQEHAGCSRCGCSPCRCSESQPRQPAVDVGTTPTEAAVHAEPVKTSTFFLEHSGQAFQSFAPLHAIHAHQCAVHNYHDDRSRFVEAHHYCSHLAEDLMQCVIYDQHDTRSARLIGVEYIIGRRLFGTLPDEEKAYWHPHAYEVSSGLLTLPGVPTMAEDKIMERLVDTYGKTWHFWQVDRGDTLPVGPAKLMSTAYGPEQLDWDVVKKRDEKFGIDTIKIGQHRAYLKHEPVDPKANA